MRAVKLAMLLIGAGVFIALILDTGIEPIRAALVPIGWGFVPIVLAHALPILLDVVAWRLLFLEKAPSLSVLFGARWIGEAVSNLLPVPQIGGDLARVRLARVAGVQTAHAAASVLVDVTLGAITQIAFALAGTLILIAGYEAVPIFPVLVALLLFGVGILIFYRLQRGAVLALAWHRVRRLPFMPAWVAKLGQAEPFQGILQAIYANRVVVARACIWRFAGWVAGAGEIFLCLHFIAYPARWTDAFVLESLSQAGRSAAFPIPGGLGAQEASFLAVGVLLGLEPSTCLALALIRRGRDVVLGVPAIVAYWLVEARRAAVLD
jgi:putative membrane protein